MVNPGHPLPYGQTSEREAPMLIKELYDLRSSHHNLEISFSILSVLVISRCATHKSRPCSS
jgi:hypothetical protein